MFVPSIEGGIVTTTDSTSWSAAVAAAVDVDAPKLHIAGRSTVALFVSAHPVLRGKQYCSQFMIICVQFTSFNSCPNV